ncbi:hypothetical protein LCL97_04800 [Seohaeicola saemankumensis]|nr:hypothetical protein [Seohaeicola saemankumensis]MCA0870129.1 hypothetical protein [Seohaeicola saemankumensis]
MLDHSRRLLGRLSPTFSRLLSRRALLSPGALLALPAPDRPAPIPRPEEVLSIPVCAQSEDDLACQDAQRRGLFLARQDRWDDLVREIREADQARDTTPGGMPVSDLLAYGARADAVQAAEHALIDGRPANDAPLTHGILGLEEALTDLRGDPYMAAVVALTHIDIAWAWRGTGWDAVVPRMNRDRCAAHFDRAGKLLAPLCGLGMNSPMIASARCGLLAGRRDPHARVADDYQDLIDLDPGNFRNMRAFGNHMLPRWFGSYGELELEARRTAARTGDHWGAGGYTWVCFDAIATDPQACATVDVDFFVDGLRDIVDRRPDQGMINLLAAYCAVALHNELGFHQDADLPRMQIAEAAGWLIRDHLTELHPLVWAHASDGFDNNARITSPTRFAARGHADALQAIAEQFRDDIANGFRVTFTPEGPHIGTA